MAGGPPGGGPQLAGQPRAGALSAPRSGPPPGACRLGVLALGDSLTNGHGGMQLGLGSQSWAHWLAQALGLPFTKLARDGEIAPGLVRAQLPAIAGEAYDLGCVWIGINDVRGIAWDPAGYEADLRTILTVLRPRCDHLLTCTIPLRLGVPPAGAKVEDANRIIERLAAEHETVVCDLRDLRGARHVWADRVHATALGQVAIADRAAAALRAAGIEVARDPSSLAQWRDSRRAWAGYLRHYARRWAVEHAVARWRLLRG